MSRSVHWASSNELFLYTPSSPTSSSSPRLSTPPSSSPDEVTIVESLRYKKDLGFTLDLSQTPREVTAISLTQTATAPSEPQIDIVYLNLPHIIHIGESCEGKGVLVGDLFLQLHRALQVHVDEEELRREKPENRQAIQAAFEARCTKLLEWSIPRSLQEKDSGVRRIDCLRGRNVFAGFSLVPRREVPTLRLHVQ